jgi:mannose-1-phosphate guanylyltransferase
MIKSNHYCVIMAGGIGSRFWPMSRSNFPKQFLDILGTGETLIQQTFNRAARFCPKENIIIVTNQDYVPLVREQISGLNADQIISEPARRNTAPCIAYASFRIMAKDPTAVMVVAPSDHLIEMEDAFVDVMKFALKTAEEDQSLITLGMKPNRPDTGYGYIQFLEDGDGAVKKVRTFTEKPDLELATKFLESGDFLWNSGIFVWSGKAIKKAFEDHLPEMYQTFEEGAETYLTENEKEFINRAYPSCKNISIDYGVMEKAENVHVIPSDFGWSDLGTWGSLYTHIPLDEDNNAVVGKNVILSNSQENMISVSGEKLVVLQGVDDLIVVEKGDVILICKKEQEQEIKQVVNNIKFEKGDRYI